MSRRQDRNRWRDFFASLPPRIRFESLEDLADCLRCVRWLQSDDLWPGAEMWLHYREAPSPMYFAFLEVGDVLAVASSSDLALLLMTVHVMLIPMAPPGW